jgi:polysaccharide biosynthesis/export protein
MKLNIKKMRVSLLSTVSNCFLLLLLLTSVLAVAQERRPSQSKPSNQSSGDTGSSNNILIDSDEDFRIGVSDVIEIKVEDATQLNGTFRVPASGVIIMNYLKRVSVLNKTTEEVAKLIADGLRGRYLKDPQVHITVVQVNSRAFYIQGAVNRPGIYQIEGRTTLFKLINMAGGLKENCGSTAYILRETKEHSQEKESDPNKASTETPKPQPVAANPSSAGNEQDPQANEDYELFTVNISKFLKGQIPQNITILPGDFVTVPTADVFFVAGEVNQPGEFTLKEGTTLRQALSLAQGTTFEAAASRTIIVRENPNTNKREEISVDLNAVMNTKKSDVAIMANDIIIVPNSRLKSVGGALLKAFGASAARMPGRF